MNKRSALGVIFRTPEYGKVKKRLAAEIGPKQALYFYREMLLTTLERVLLLKDVDIFGFYDGRFPKDIAVKFKKICFINQRGNDLGEKLTHAAVYLLGKGYDNFIFIGADSPDLPLQYILEGFWRLKSFDLILGPSADGGYYLIGMKRLVSTIFSNIPWGCPDVLKTTILKAEMEKLSYSLLPPWYDIDDLKTLKRWLVSAVVKDP